jgi:hypothetical protein
MRAQFNIHSITVIQSRGYELITDRKPTSAHSGDHDRTPPPAPFVLSLSFSYPLKFTVAGEARVVCVNGCEPDSKDGTKYPPVHDNI